MRNSSSRITNCSNLIKEIESNIISEKPWYFNGEITNGNRPLNSTLQADFTHKRDSRVVSTTSSQRSKTLEDIIKRKIQTYKPVKNKINTKTVLDSNLNNRSNLPESSIKQIIKDTDRVIKKNIKSLYEELIHRITQLFSKQAFDNTVL
jgi:U3 small nucleolar ribonucleoprotein component